MSSIVRAQWISIVGSQEASISCSSLGVGFHTSQYGGRSLRAYSRLHGFVGDANSPVAKEYHSKDFEWDDLYEDVRLEIDDHSEAWIDSGVQDIYDPSCWESFHAQHGKGHFFKERRYLTLEFPALKTEDPPQHFVDIGSGCGSSILPVLRANSTCSCTACDVSPSALELLQQGARTSGVKDLTRIKTLVLDVSQDPLIHPTPLAGSQADCALLIFTLSAVPPDSMLNVLEQASCCLKTGGLVLFRDYGLCDSTQLRYKPSQRKGKRLYQRQDGTLAYYFTTDYIDALMLEVGFTSLQCEYVCVIWKNRKTEQELKRVFVHGVFQKA